MSNQTQGREHFRYQSFRIDKNQQLGNGAYGAVYKAKCDQLPCAAKVIHPTIIDPCDPGAGKIMQRFYQECAFLENIRHPNIVQYLGMSRDPESGLPLLLMELLDESLTKMLESSKQPLAYHVQVDICHDIALAVAYLHSNDIIHRDLSSNNVLIIAKRRAKVTDFGMSKLAGAAPSMTPQTLCPGTLAYMPPEAQDEPPKYTRKLDCFSEGVIMIQVCTLLWPEPGPRTKRVPFPTSPTGVIQMPVLDTERRKNHIDLIDRRHPLLLIAIDCLNYREKDRPSSEDLCERLADLKKMKEYVDSVRKFEVELNDIANLRREIKDMETKESAAVQQLQQEIQQLQEKILKLNKQLEKRGKVTTEPEAETSNKQSPQMQTAQRPSRLSPQNITPPSSSPLSIPNKNPMLGMFDFDEVEASISHTIPLEKGKWTDGERLPNKMARGDAVASGNRAYFMSSSGETYSFSLITNTWSEHLRCPCWDGCLAAVKGLITAIGGRGPRNKLLSLVTKLVEEASEVKKGFRFDKSGRPQKQLDKRTDQKWVERFPTMPTKRSHAAAVTTKQYLIVVGGVSGSSRLDTVEVMDIQRSVWSSLSCLLHPCYLATATVCGDQLYIIGGFDKSSSHTKSVQTCSLTKLMQSRKDVPPALVWNRITDAPVFCSTSAAVNGELVVVGGGDKEKSKTSAIHKYNPTADFWEVISHMPTARTMCLVAVLHNKDVIVAGGAGVVGSVSSIEYTDKVEIARL